MTAAENRRAKARGEDRAKPDTKAMTGLGLAIRLGLDFVAGVVVGVGIGLLLDWWWGTKPLMMILFLLLGAAAGTFNVIRTASGYGGAVGYRPSDANKVAEDRRPADKPDE